MARNHKEHLVRLVRKLGLVRPRDLQSAGIPRVYLAQLVKQGELLKTGRGLYVDATTSFTENHSLAEAAKRAPKGVVCLLSALRFHDLTTENPAEVWLAVPRETRRPRSGVPALRIMQFSGEMMLSGIERHTIATTFKRRGTPFPDGLPVGLTATFSQDPVKTRGWEAFCRKTVSKSTVSSLETVVRQLAGFLEPPLFAAAKGENLRKKWESNHWTEK